MKLLTYLLFLLTFLCVGVAQVHAQQNGGSFLQGLIGYFQNNGHAALANVISQVNNTARGQALFEALGSQNYTVFAPVDVAFQNQSALGNGSVENLFDIVSYHILPGDFTNTSSPDVGQPIQGTNATTADLLCAVYPNTTLGRTFLNDTQYVTLEGNKSQVLAWTRNQSDEPIYILNQEFGNITVQNSTRYFNLLINSIPSILTPPPPLPDALSRANLSIISYIIAMAPAPPGFFLSNVSNTTEVSVGPPNSNVNSNSNSNVNSKSGTTSHTLSTTLPTLDSNPTTINTSPTNSTLLDALTALGNTSLTTHPGGYTIFAPDDAALLRSLRTVEGYLSNETSVEALIYNHWINGTTVYSSEFGELNNTGVAGSAGSESNGSSGGQGGQGGSSNTSTPNFFTAAGQPIFAWSNSSGTFVTTQGSDGVPAKLVRSDVLTNNGVVHIIDNVLVNVDENQEVASSAYASGTSFAAAAASSTQSGPIGLVPGFTTSSASSSSASSSETSQTTTEASTTSSA